VVGDVVAGVEFDLRQRGDVVDLARQIRVESRDDGVVLDLGVRGRGKGRMARLRRRDEEKQRPDEEYGAAENGNLGEDRVDLSIRPDARIN
jgi:hypothetical protein